MTAMPDTPQLKCGLIAVIGAPNAGKSTLVNMLVGQKVAITSAKAQTTRTRLMGIALSGATQMLLVDTPGIFEPGRRLDRAMVSAAWEGTDSADVIALIIDAKSVRRERLDRIIDGLTGRKERLILVLNKVDIARKDLLLVQAQEFAARVNFAEVFFVSAQTGEGVDELKNWLANAMPDSPWHFPEDQVSDASERLLATEITREQLYQQLHEELPYDSAVVHEKYLDRRDGSLEIHQQILVARASQRSIVLGKNGTRIKAIGSAARAELKQLLGREVHLFLHVKHADRWDEDRDLYAQIGLDWVR